MAALEVLESTGIDVQEAALAAREALEYVRLNEIKAVVGILLEKRLPLGVE